MSISKANKIVIEAISPTVQRTRLYAFDKAEVIVGRSFSCDLILEDDFVSREHLSITLMDDGRIKLTDLNSENGTHIRKNLIRGERATLKSGQTCKIGKTKLRIFMGGHELKPARRLNFGAKLQTFFDNPVIAFVLFSFSVFFGTLYSWAVDDPQNFMEEKVYMTAFTVACCILVLAIIGAIGKIVSHKKPRFTGEISSYSLVVFMLVAYIWFIRPYLFFYISTMVVSWVMTVFVTMVFFIALGFFASYIEEGRIVRKTMGFALILGAFVAGISFLDDLGYADHPDYPAQILVGDYSDINLETPDEFLEESAKLFNRAKAE